MMPFVWMLAQAAAPAVVDAIASRVQGTKKPSRQDKRMAKLIETAAGLNAAVNQIEDLAMKSTSARVKEALVHHSQSINRERDRAQRLLDEARAAQMSDDA